MGMAIAGGIHVMLMIYAIGGISGAHMNRAVSFVFVLKGILPFATICITHITCLEPNFSIFYLIKFPPFATVKS
jgi:glycerol uptake facilitator-like aquaporin